MKDHLGKKICTGILFFQLLFICSAVQSQSIDVKWLKSINYNYTRSPAMDRTMDGVSKSMYAVAVAVPVTQLIVGYSTHDPVTIRNGWLSVAGQGLTQALTWSGKYGVRRDRPFVSHPDINTNVWDNSPSFPSGHTSTAFSTATMLSLQYPKWYVIAPSFLWAGSMGYSRMYLGRHYPSDVFAGALVGAGSSYLCYKLNKWLQGKKRNRERSFANPLSPLNQ